MHIVLPASLCPSSEFDADFDDDDGSGIAMSLSVTVGFVVLVAMIWPRSTDLRLGAPEYTGAEVAAVATVESSREVKMPMESSPQWRSRYWNYELSQYVANGMCIFVQGYVRAC